MTVALLLMAMAAAFLPLGAAQAADPGTDPAKEIVALERTLLDRWGTGDTLGFIEVSAPEVTYFSPGLEKRLDGIEAFGKLLAKAKGTFRIARYEMIDPKVQAYGEVAVLTFNLVNYDETGQVTSRWNATEVYRRLDSKWKLVHSHWAWTKPKAK